MEVRLLEPLIKNPRTVDPTPEQLTALKVLADQWSQDGLAGGIWLAEQLQGPVTEQRRAELGFSDWHGVDLRQQAILFDRELRSPIAQLAEVPSFAIAIRLLCWVGAHEAASPLHALVAQELNSMLRLVEQRQLAVVSYEGWKFQLANGWQLDVFVRGYDFWRIDELVSPEGFAIGPADFREGPLADLKNYEPPEDIEADVYGLGPRPTRRWG